MKIAVTGSDGMLGSDIIKAFSDCDITGFTINDFDITDLDESVAAIKLIKPDLLIHSAAYTDVDKCESVPEKAYLVNGIGSRNMTIACEEMKCPIMYISSDYVFDGTKSEPYHEWDTPNPINTYGLSKLLGEKYVMSLTNRFYIIRTSWLFGKNGINFVNTIDKLLLEREELDIVDDQIGAPTYTCDLAVTLRKLSGKGYGIYHITNSSHCSWYEFAVAIRQIREGKSSLKPTTSEKLSRPAKRPSNSVLSNTLLRLEGIRELRHWREALKSYLDK